MKARNGWLFPMMVLAAGSVSVFGCIGIAAITGYLPLAKVSPTPLGEPRVMVRAAEWPSILGPKSPPGTVVVSNVEGHPDSTAPAGEGQAAKAGPGRKKTSP